MPHGLYCQLLRDFEGTFLEADFVDDDGFWTFEFSCLMEKTIVAINNFQPRIGQFRD